MSESVSEHLRYVKTCSRCSETKDFGEFARNSRRADGLQVYCKPCKREYDKRHYKKNPKWFKERNEKRLSLFREIVRIAKSVPCMDCGVQYHPYVMDFDHVRGAKIFTIADVSSVSSEKSLRAEIAKCEVVCSNCHRMRTLLRNHSGVGELADPPDSESGDFGGSTPPLGAY